MSNEDEDPDQMWARGILDECAGWDGGFVVDRISSTCGWRGSCDERPTFYIYLSRGPNEYSAAHFCEEHAAITVAEIRRRRSMS